MTLSFLTLTLLTESSLPHSSMGCTGSRSLFLRRRAIRVFRDESTLAMTPQIWPEIEKALRSSRFFILMADPLSAKSEWVQKEVACWVAMKRTEKMLIVWTGGDLVWDKARKDFAWSSRRHTSGLMPQRTTRS